MATTETPDYIPIESLEVASKLNLIGGGILLLCAGWLLYRQNDDNWPIPSEWIILLIVGAILLALASAVLRIFNGYFRYRLFKATLENETLTPAQIEKLAKLINDAKLIRELRNLAGTATPDATNGAAPVAGAGSPNTQGGSS